MCMCDRVSKESVCVRVCVRLGVYIRVCACVCLQKRENRYFRAFIFGIERD